MAKGFIIVSCHLAESRHQESVNQAGRNTDSDSRVANDAMREKSKVATLMLPCTSAQVTCCPEWKGGSVEVSKDVHKTSSDLPTSEAVQARFDASRLPERIPADQQHRLRFCPAGTARDQLQPEIAPPSVAEIYPFSGGTRLGWVRKEMMESLVVSPQISSHAPHISSYVCHVFVVLAII